MDFVNFIGDSFLNGVAAAHYTDGNIHKVIAETGHGEEIGSPKVMNQAEYDAFLDRVLETYNDALTVKNCLVELGVWADDDLDLEADDLY